LPLSEGAAAASAPGAAGTTMGGARPPAEALRASTAVLAYASQPSASACSAATTSASGRKAARARKEARYAAHAARVIGASPGRCMRASSACTSEALKLRA
jgi:hypothetical protein